MRIFGRHTFEGPFFNENELNSARGVLLVLSTLSEKVLHVEMGEDVSELVKTSPLKDTWESVSCGDYSFWVKYSDGQTEEDLLDIQQILRFHYHLTYLATLNYSVE